MGKLLVCKATQRHNPSEFDKSLLITRYGSVDGWTQERRLSPSHQLFSKVVQWKKSGLFKQMFQEFSRLFIKELLESTESCRALASIRTDLDNGKVIVIGCFCNDRKYCHRSIIGQIFESSGYSVNYID